MRKGLALFAFFLYDEEEGHTKGASELKQANPPSVSLKDTIYQSVVEMICSGQLTPNMIFTEQQLISHFQVSKSPVREALIQLCGEGVLRSIPRHGYQVVEISRQNVQDLTQLRMYLELGNLPQAMEHLTPERLLELKRQNDERRQPSNAKHIWDSWNRNSLFHMTLIEYGENAQVARVMKQVLATCTRAYAQSFTAKKSLIAPSEDNQHDLIVRALELHDIYAAHEHLRRDILLMGESLYPDSEN